MIDQIAVKWNGDRERNSDDFNATPATKIEQNSNKNSIKQLNLIKKLF